MFGVHPSFARQTKSDSLTAVLQQPLHDTSRINLLLALANEYIYTAHDTAIIYAEQALALATTVIAREHSDRSNLFDNADEIASLPLAMTRWAANSHHTIGYAHYLQGNYEKTLFHWQKALEIRKRDNDKKGISASLGNIGSVYSEQDDYPKALSYYFKALEMDSVMGNKSGIARHLGNIGIVYHQQCDYPKALSYYFKALEMNSVMGNKIDIAIGLGNIGAVYTEMKQYAQAEKYLKQSLALSDSIGVLHNTMSFEKSICELYAQTNKWQNAYNHQVLYSDAKDTLFGEEKSKAVGRVEMKHEMEMAQIEELRIKNYELRIMNERIARRNLLQYSLILLALGVLFVVILFSRRMMAKLPDKILFIKVNKAKVGFGFIFVFIMMLFESMLLFTDPYVSGYAQGAPGVILLLNALLACILFPVNFILEKALAKKTGIAKPVSSGGMGTMMGMVALVVFNSFVVDDGVVDSLLSEMKKPNLHDTEKVNLLNVLFSEYEFTNADKATEYITQALKLSEKIKYSKGLIQTYTNLGFFAEDTGNYAATLTWYQKALEIDSVSGNKSGIAKHFGNIGLVYRKQGDYPKALSYYFKALEIDSVMGNSPDEALAQAGKRGIAIALGNIGIVYKNQGDYPKALSYYFKALEMDSVMGYKIHIAVNLGNIGNVYNDQGDYPKAISYYFKALEMDSAMGNKSGIARHLGNIGIVYSEQASSEKTRQDIAVSDSLFKKALDYYFRALKIDEELGDKNGVAIDLGNIGALYTKMNKSAYALEKRALADKAEHYLQQALALSDSIGALLSTMTFEKSISELYVQTGKWQNAYTHHVAYRTARDSVFGEEKSKAIGRVEMKHEMEMAEYRKKIEEEEKRKQEAAAVGRRNELQYGAIFIGFFILLGGVFMLSRLMLPVWFIEFLTFVPFLILFEFILVLLDPHIDGLTAGAPALRLLFNALVAGLLYPLQQFSEHKLKMLFYRRKRRRVSL